MAQIFASILLFYTLAGLTIFEDLTPIRVNLFKEECMFTNIPRPSFLNQIQCRKDISASSWRKSFSRCYRINSSNFPIIMKISFPCRKSPFPQEWCIQFSHLNSEENEDREGKYPAQITEQVWPSRAQIPDLQLPVQDLQFLNY